MTICIMCKRQFIQIENEHTCNLICRTKFGNLSSGETWLLTARYVFEDPHDFENLPWYKQFWRIISL